MQSGSAEVPASTALLRAAARMQLDPPAGRAFAEAAGRVQRWPALVADAEDHGLSPLLRLHAASAGVEFPAVVRQQLASLAVRHREASRVHTAALLEMLEALERRGVRPVVLKGAVLAHELYARPEYRPRRDIDLLVSKADALPAVGVLRSLGYDGPAVAPDRRHHHLPGMTTEREGFRVSVEVHTDVLSPDQPDRLSLDTALNRLRTVDVGGTRVQALGHEDMIRHLAAHLLEPGHQTRLINVVDLVAYAERHVETIDWDRVRRASARTLVTLSLMHYLTGLPEALAWARPTSDAPQPSGVGYGFPMLSTVNWKERPLTSTLAELLYPSAWWMHAFYAVPPGCSLAFARWTRHAPRLLHWGLRRVTSQRGT
ncbi:MAG: nucleotidyltransferase family protein [Vicinamibacterales bacterium]